MRYKRDLTILEFLQEHRAASVSELAQVTGASEATIRRDLARLDESGALRRTYGGAALHEEEGDAPFVMVEEHNRAAKERIARAAADSIEEGSAVILDVGTTVLRLAERLRGRRLTVITSNIAVLEMLQDDENLHLVLLPGDYDRTYRCVSGHLAINTLRLIHADRAFLGVSGIAANGDLRDTTIAQVPMKQAIAAACDATTVLADSGKFPGTGTARIVLPDVPTTVITDAAPTGGVIEAFASRKLEVVVA